MTADPTTIAELLADLVWKHTLNRASATFCRLYAIRPMVFEPNAPEANDEMASRMWDLAAQLDDEL